MKNKRVFSEKEIEQCKKNLKYGYTYGFKGKKHNKETKKKMSLLKKGKTWEEIYGKQYAEKKKAQTQKRLLQEGHWNWKGGVSRSPGFYNLIKMSLKQQCVFCGTSKSLAIHHIDKNVRNNKLDNLMILCYSCHIKLHKRKL